MVYKSSNDYGTLEYFSIKRIICIRSVVEMAIKINIDAFVLVLNISLLLCLVHVLPCDEN